jgi:hypothetical protein
MTEQEEIEARAAWNVCSGRKVALDHVVGVLEHRAGVEYVEGRDEIAKAFRDVLKDVRKMRDAASEELSEHIAKNTRRHGKGPAR